MVGNCSRDSGNEQAICEVILYHFGRLLRFMTASFGKQSFGKYLASTGVWGFGLSVRFMGLVLGRHLAPIWRLFTFGVSCTKCGYILIRHWLRVIGYILG